jgi:hypothetical protein
VATYRLDRPLFDVSLNLPRASRQSSNLTTQSRGRPTSKAHSTAVRIHRTVDRWPTLLRAAGLSQNGNAPGGPGQSVLSITRLARPAGLHEARLMR